MAQLQFRLGENINEILLDIAQNKLKEGDFAGAIGTYTQSFEGFPEELAIGILQGKLAIRPIDDGLNIDVTDDIEVVVESRTHLPDWTTVIKSKIGELKGYCEYIIWLRSKVLIDLNDHCLVRYLTDPTNNKEVLAPLNTLVARYLAGHDVDGNYKLPPFQRMMSIGNEDIEALNADEKRMYCIVQYFRTMKHMHKDLIKLDKLYHALRQLELIDEVPFIADVFENCLHNFLIDFYDTEKGYHHPACDEEVIKLKEQMYDEMMLTEFGKEYLKNGICVKNMLDGYDAGYLAPNGDFYGLRGAENEMLHIQLGNMLIEKMFPQFGKDSSFDVEYNLMKMGYMKVHHDRIFGHFAFDREDVANGQLWCPTETQIKCIYEYANKFYGGQINTDSTIGCNMVKVSALRQMDDIALRNTFKI